MNFNPPPNKINWTPRRLRLLKRNWNKMPARELAILLRLKITVVRIKCYELGLRKFVVYHWTPVQVRFLEKNFTRMGDVEIAEQLTKRFPGKSRWTEKHVRKKRIYLNLNRTVEQVKAVRRRNSRQGRYAVVEKSWITRGKAPVGTVRPWRNQHGYTRLYVKTDKGWTPYLRWLYQKTHGVIPRGEVVTVKDGNQLNTDTSNLVLMTRRQMAGQNSRYDTFLAARMAIGLENKCDHNLKRQILKHPEFIAVKRKQLELEKLLHGKR